MLLKISEKQIYSVFVTSYRAFRDQTSDLESLPVFALTKAAKSGSY